MLFVSLLCLVNLVVHCVSLITGFYIIWRRWISCEVQWIVWIHSVLYASWV